MASNSVEFRVVVNADGLVTGLKQVTNFGNETQKAGKKAREAGDAADHLNYKMNQGVTGASSASRSFSKLSQTIGQGNGGLVGAYATLAANAFAVSAAFNALRSAAQVEQLMEGLEFQGAKTGRTLSTVASSIQEITEGSLSAADAMRSAALGSSAGLTASDLEKLTQVATNASKVLGRNLPDSMDRIIKGVTKLEPELLDELGLMTKLTEASEIYARQVGKSAAALTNFEKRRAFVQAIQKEGESKFGGVELEVDVNQFDRLSAAFENLTQNVLGFISTSQSLGLILDNLINTYTGLAGAVLIFASTIKNQLLGSFAQMAETSKKVAEKSKETADDLSQKAEVALASSKVMKEAAKNNMQAASDLNKGLRGKAKALVPEFTSLNVTDDESLKKSDRLSQDIIANRTASIKRYELEIKKLEVIDTEANRKSIAGKKEQIAANTLLIESTRELQKARAAEFQSVSANKVQGLTAEKAQSRATKEGAVSNALTAASSLEIPSTFKNVKEAVKAYNSELNLNAQAAKATAAASNTTLSGLARLQVGFIGVRTAAFATTTALKAVGVGLLAILPYVGLALAAFSVVEMIYDKLFVTDADRAQSKAFEELTAVTESTDSKIKELNRTLESNLQLGEKSIQANIIKSNSLLEMADAYIKVAEAAKLSSEESAGGTGQPTSKTYRTLFPKLGGVFGQSKEEENLVKSAEQLAILAPELSEEFLKQAKAASTSEEVFQAYERTMRKVKSVYKPLSESLENFKAQLKTTDEAQANFTKSMRPTTQFDEIAQGYIDLNRSLKQVQDQMDKAGNSGVKAKEEFRSMLTGIGSNLAANLQPQTQSLLRVFNDITLAIAEVKRQREEGTISDEKALSKINALEREQNKILADRQDKTKGLSSLIREELKAREEQLVKNQINQISAQSSANLAQSELAVLQRKGIISVEALRKQQKLQDSIVDSQVSQLRLKTELAEIQYRGLQTTILELEAQQNILEALKNQGDQARRTSLEKIQKNEKETPVRRAAATAMLSTLDAGLPLSATQISQNLGETKAQGKVQLATIQASKNATKAAANQALSANEKIANEQQKSLEIDITKNALSRQVNESTENRRQIEARLNDQKSGGLNTLSLELDAIKNNATLRKKAIEDEASESIRALQTQQVRLKGDTAAVKILQDQIDKKTEIKDVQLSSLELQTKEEILNKIGIKNAADALQIVQQTLEVYQRRVDLARELVDQEAQIFRNRAEIDILRSGGQVDERSRKAIEVDVANIALQSAIDQNELRMQSITMEFALLKAQRELQLIDLKAKEKTLRDLGNTQSADIILAGIKNLENFDYGALEAMQIKQANNVVKIARQGAQRAAEEFNNTLRPENFANTAFKNLALRLAIPRRAQQDSKSPLPTVPGQDSPQDVSNKKPFDNLKLSFMEVLDVINTGVGESMRQFEELSAAMSERLGQDFGPQGKLLQSLSAAMISLTNNFKLVSDSINKVTEVSRAKAEDAMTKMTESSTVAAEQVTTTSQTTEQAQQKSKEGFKTQMQAASAAFGAIASITGAIASILKASSDAKIAGIDKEIAAEQKRDGKSAESISKIQALEKKKDDMARKSFNTQKKLMIAQAIMGTASAVTGALALLPNPIAIPLAAIVGAMGLAQVAIIAGTQYGGGVKSAAAATPSTLSIGKRSDTVDLARGPSANAGGEVGFLRGSQGMGTNASNFRTIGSAYGGELMRGYGNRGFVVGEKGPEVITPETPINVTPANDVMGSAPVNATINIQALDASGVENILVSQKGNIIKMLRQAANASGQGFLEDVNVNVYTRPNVNRL
jgi:hypothetical protein